MINSKLKCPVVKIMQQDKLSEISPGYDYFVIIITICHGEADGNLLTYVKNEGGTICRDVLGCLK